jgi:hypothetical protein
VSYDRFVAEVQPTAVQRHVIDSLLGLAQDRIASSVLVGEDNTFAIDPELPRLNRVMVAGIASCLEAPQRRRMERLLAEHDAPYAVSAERAAPPQEVMARFGPGERPNRFMIITPDTTMFTEVRIDFDSLQRTVVRNMQRFQRRQQEMFNRMQAGEFRWISRPGALPAPSAVAVDSDYFRVDFAPPVPDLPSEMHVMVTPRGQMEETTREFDNGQVHIRIFESHMKAPHAPQPPRARANRDTTRSVLTPQERPD